MADFKGHSPIEEENRLLTDRDSSLDDFEKLENIIIQEKGDDFLLPQDLLGGSNEPLKVTEDLVNKARDHRDIHHDLLGDFTNDYVTSTKTDSSPAPPAYEDHDDFFSDVLQATTKPAAVEPRPNDSLFEFEHAEQQLQEEEEEHPRQYSEAKLVHPPSDSGYVPSPVEESTEIEENLPSYSPPKIDPLEAQFSRSDKYIEKQSPVVSREATGPSLLESPRKANTMSSDSTSKGSAGGCPFSPSALFDPNRLNPTVTSLVYWRDPKKSGIVFGVTLLFLLCLRYFSFITVVSYLALAVISITLSFRIYKNILQAVQKSTDGHPFKELLELDMSIAPEKVHESADVIVEHAKCTILKLRALFLVEDLIDSIKLGIVLWCLTYLGAWFNGLTLITLGFIAVFSLPKVYETNKAQIDQYLGLVCSQVSGIVHTVKSKLPFGQKEKAQ